MNTNLLTIFNSYAFHNSAQCLLSNLNITELKQLLLAISDNKTYLQLSHMIRATLFMVVGNSFDRTFYFMHYDGMECENLRKERIALIAQQTQSHNLENILKRYEIIQENGKQLLQDEFQAIWEAFTNPDLALPPYVRENIAPHCQTVYQIELALSNTQQFQENLCIESEEKSEYIKSLLIFQIQVTKIQLQSIKDKEAHFAELVIRYMLYRNTVLAIHSIFPFKKLSQPMQIWKQSLLSHIIRANQVYISLLDINEQGDAGQYGYFTPELFRNQGYMIEYSEMLVDLSVDEKNVVFNGHSKQIFDTPYTFLQEQLLFAINQASKNVCQNYDILNKLQQNGLKPCTIRKIIDTYFIQNEQTDKCKQDFCCKNDNFIQNCARINMNFDRSPTFIHCF